MQALAKIATTIDKMNRRIGRYIAWLALFMILVQFIVVVMRYVFGIGSIFMQESIVYMHGLMFMVGAGFTLLNDGHVRVDIFYGDAKPKTKALINLVGSIIFLMPFCVIAFWVSYPYVANAWSVYEGSPETSGIQAVFLLKSVILVFCVLVALQGISLAIHSLFVLRGLERPGDRDPAATEL